MNRQVHTVFCDDIRQEIGGKVSLIGVYSGKMLVSSFPAVLPKVCLVLSVVTPASDPFRALNIRITRDEELITEMKLEEKDFTSSVEAASDMPEDQKKDRILLFQPMFVFSPFKVDGPCILRVRVGTENGELRGVGLKIELGAEKIAS